MLRFFKSTIGKKVIVAVTGLILFGFVIGHLAGNLQIFAGSDKLNEYAAFLKANPPLLWGTRIILLLAAALHILCIAQLTLRNRLSRFVSYQQSKTIQAGWASRLMILSGALLFAYIIFHLLHLTAGWIHPDFSHTDVYRNMIIGFSSLPVVAIYTIGLVALGAHLYHGVWSVFQTLGLNQEKYNAWRRVFAITAAVLLSAGYILIPVAVYLKVVR